MLTDASACLRLYVRASLLARCAWCVRIPVGEIHGASFATIFSSSLSSKVCIALIPFGTGEKSKRVGARPFGDGWRLRKPRTGMSSKASSDTPGADATAVVIDAGRTCVLSLTAAVRGSAVFSISLRALRVVRREPVGFCTDTEGAAVLTDFVPPSTVFPLARIDAKNAFGVAFASAFFRADRVNARDIVLPLNSEGVCLKALAKGPREPSEAREMLPKLPVLLIGGITPGVNRMCANPPVVGGGIISALGNCVFCL
mmetsp:Transcript_5497/g.20028  ORF Transcript_5497/g.20028 Transcript_5497/m.20028 type:complete len:257 (-) Transcript_5497:1592-2362(-)